MNHIVIGFGEIGKSIYQYLLDYDNIKDEIVEAYDINMSNRPSGKYDVMHVCIPFINDFVEVVKEYQNEFLSEKGITIIHSTVNIGTSRILGAVYSPVRGVHPNIVKGLKTFVKFFAGKNAKLASSIFRIRGTKVNVHTGPTATEDLEASKLWDTTQYGWQIVLNKYMKKWCDQQGLDFDVIYTQFNKTYNDGYTKLNRPEVVRPYLRHMPGAIGGHCVIPNCKILNEFISGIILKANEEFSI